MACIRCFANHAQHQFGGYEFNCAAFGKSFGILRKSPRRHYKPTNRPFSRHHPVELPDRRHAHLVDFPLLALDQVLVLAHSQFEVHATSRTVSTPLYDLETLAAETSAVSPSNSCHEIDSSLFRLGLAATKPCN